MLPRRYVNLGALHPLLGAASGIFRARQPAAYAIFGRIQHKAGSGITLGGFSFGHYCAKRRTIPLPGSLWSRRRTQPSACNNMPPRGLEPPRPYEHRSSTCRVCQFRHGGLSLLYLHLSGLSTRRKSESPCHRGHSTRRSSLGCGVQPGWPWPQSPIALQSSAGERQPGISSGVAAPAWLR